MNKYIFALILTLLGWTQLQAQNTDLRSAPDVPTFRVTLEYEVTGGGAEVTATSENKTVDTGTQLALGAKVQLVVTMKAGYKLTSIQLTDGNNVVSDVTTAVKGQNATGQTTYTLTHTMGDYAKFTFNTNEKTAVSPYPTVENLQQILASLKDVKEVTLNHNLDGFQVWYKYSESGTWETFDAAKFTEFGEYPVLITREEDENYLAFNSDAEEANYKLQLIQQTVYVGFSYDPVVYGESLTATVDGKPITSGDKVAVNSDIIYTFVANKGYRLEKITKIASTDIYTNFTGEMQEGKSVYTFKMTVGEHDFTLVFHAVAKTDFVGLNIENLEQTEGALQDVTVTGAPDNVTDFTVRYKVNGEWTETLPKDLKAGYYEVEITRDEDLTYNAYKYEGQLVIKAGEPEQPIEPEKIAIVLNTTDLKATSVEVGKVLSTSVLSGGYAQTTDKDNPITIVGTFEWKDPATVVSTAGEAEYAVVFTPIDLRYAQAETKVKVGAVQYCTVTTAASANGKVEIQDANAANKYEAGTTLTLVYTPDAHYQVAANQPTTYKVEKDDVITGQFEAIMHTVTIAEPQNGTLTVKNGETEVTDGTAVAEGTQLNITATPAVGYKLASLTNGANQIRNNSITVEGDLNIQATFEALPAEEFVVSVGDMANGKLILLDENGNSVSKGSSVKRGTKLTVVAVADKGYELSGDVMAGDTKVSGTYEVTASTEFTAVFKKISYSITKTQGDVTITVKKDNEEVSKAEIGDELTISAAVTNANKRLLSLVVNGKEIANGSTYTVENAVNIVASLVDKAKIQLLDLDQVVTYDGNGKQFVVRSIPAGLQFTVKYEGVEEGQLPIYAANNSERTYKVTITRDADELYQAVDATGSLTIKAALAAYKAPTWENGTWSNGEEGSFEEEEAADDQAFRKVTFTPKNANHQKVTFSVAKELNPAKKIIPNVTLRADAASSLNVEATGGMVTFWNGTAQVNEVYAGQTILIKGLPEAGNSSMAIWNGNVEQPAEELQVPLVEGANIVSVKFRAKTEPALPEVGVLANNQYTGSAIVPTITSSLSGWDIVVKAGDLVVDHPTEVGTYKVYASRSEDQVYASVFEKEIGSYTIMPQVLKAEDFTITASAVMKGFSLSESVLSATAPVAGTFTWANPAMIVEESTSYSVIFIPDSRNYTAEGLSLSTTVPILDASAAVVVRKITFDTADHGSFEVKVNGIIVTSGAQVTQGDKVEVSTIADNGYSLGTVKINGRVTTGVYTVGETGDVVVTVTFTPVTTPGGGVDEPETPSEPETPTEPETPSEPETPTIPDTPTGIEAISEGSQLYAVKGAVVVVPAEPLQVAIYAVTGQTLFNDEVSYFTQVPAKAGIYVVAIKKGANTITEKVIVR